MLQIKLWPTNQRKYSYISQFLDNLLPRELQNRPVRAVVHFVTSQKMQQLNKEYRQIDSTTNVLAFPISWQDQNNSRIVDLGDVFISRVQAQKLSTSIEHLIVHGFMHLLGHTHQTRKEQRKWHKIETAVLSDLNKKYVRSKKILW